MDPSMLKILHVKVASDQARSIYGMRLTKPGSYLLTS